MRSNSLCCAPPLPLVLLSLPPLPALPPSSMVRTARLPLPLLSAADSGVQISLPSQRPLPPSLFRAGPWLCRDWLGRESLWVN
jgi:hypothetical protein